MKHLPNTIPAGDMSHWVEKGTKELYHEENSCVIGVSHVSIVGEVDFPFPEENPTVVFRMETYMSLMGVSIYLYDRNHDEIATYDLNTESKGFEKV